MITNTGITKEHFSKRLLFLDGLRGIAALYVMIGHARWLLWEGYSEGYLKHPERYGLINKLLMYFFSLFRYGHEAVLFFFVLSGFVIHLKYAKNLSKSNDSNFKWSEYLYRRIKRIYPPFLFALILTLLLDSIGRRFQYTIYSGATPYNLINDNLGRNDWSIKSLLGNLFFLYKAYIPIYGTNGPAWSLKYEWWFYMFYPLFLLAGRRNIVYPSLLMVILFIASFFPDYWPEQLSGDIFSMMITWWLGVILAEVYTGRIKVSYSHLSFLTLAILFKPVLSTQNVMSDLCMAFFFLGFISIFLLLSERNMLIRFLEKLKILGDFSFTLYITHFPILVFMSGWLMHRNGNWLPSHFIFIFIGIIITLAFAYIFHFITEIPFINSKTKSGTSAERKLQSI